MSARHTAGPWLSAPAGGRMLDVYSQSWGIASTSGRNLVAGVFNDGNGGEDAARANAHLIAAAPELLEALEALMPSNVSLTNRNIRDMHTLPMDVEVGALRRAAAAIAKARGAA